MYMELFATNFLVKEEFTDNLGCIYKLCQEFVDHCIEE
jgi:hypothetical protein